jgi:UDP-N-acetylglucosamine 2-epimerase (non-hydrolysing)
MQPDQTLAKMTSLMFEKMDECIRQVKPDLLMVQGDTTSAMVAALVAFYAGIKVAHVEAGLRSFNKLAPFPEEVNRKIISQVADAHFAPTNITYTNLKNESAENVHVVGNTVIDSFLMGKMKIDQHVGDYKARFEKIFDLQKKLILITAHRRESFGEGLRNICEAILNLSQKHPECEFVFPVHLNPNIKNAVHAMLSNQANVHLLMPVQYDEMIFLMANSFIILTDSGGIQEEAPSLNIPLIVLRDVTERPEGIEAGCAILGGTEASKIVEVFENIYNNSSLYTRMQKAPNPYGDGQTSQRIRNILEQWL